MATDDWATSVAARVLASLEGGPYVADDVERIAAALRAEREACAKIADAERNKRNVDQTIAEAIAEAIRNRK